MLKAERLRCEHLENPIGLDRPTPRLGWVVSSDERCQVQAAYRVRVATDPKLLETDQPDLWDTGRVESDRTIDIVYSGRLLTAHMRCYWQVRVWDGKHEASAWSDVATWVVGILDPEAWRGEWIGFDEPVNGDAAEATDPFTDALWIGCPQISQEAVDATDHRFHGILDLPADSPIRSAEVWSQATVVYQLSINGIGVTETLAAPGGGTHIEHALISTFLQPGRNRIDVKLSSSKDGSTPAFRAQLVVCLEDGRVINCFSDESWGYSYDASDVAQSTHAVRVSVESLDEKKVNARWRPLVTPPPRYLRRVFECSRPIRSAMLYVTALGIADPYLNGESVSDQYFDPGWTDYTKRVYYRAWDMTGKVNEGRNTLGLVLADGWYSGYIGYASERNHYGKQLRARVNLVLHYEDGSTDVICTDSRWKATTGPTLSADFLQGESFDARMAEAFGEWCGAEYDDASWSVVTTDLSEVHPAISWHPGPGVAQIGELEPVSVMRVGPGVYIYDLGQNIAGVARLRIDGAPGQVVQLRYAERLNTDGTLYRSNLRSAAAIDRYVCHGQGIETWSPRFTFHGFQYIEVSGLREEPAPGLVVGLAISSDTPVAGSFNCSDELLNRLASNTYWTQRMNFIDIPTDCPQRDERLGWTGDIQVFINAAVLHCDVQAFMDKWLTDLTDAQRDDGQYPMVAPLKVAHHDGGPAWAEAGVICPWVMYQTYADTGLLQRQYDSIRRFIDFCRSRSVDGILPPQKYHCFGDWVHIDDATPHDVIYLAYYAHAVDLASRMARVLGNHDDADRNTLLHDRVREAFVKTCVEDDGRVKGDSQTAYVLAIRYGLVRDRQLAQAAEHLVRRIRDRETRLSTGFVGTKDLLDALCMVNRTDVAYELLLGEGYPSWKYSILQGATSIWERWDGWTEHKGFQTATMNSFAHYAFGGVYQWMVKHIGGIRPAEPGYAKIIIEPEPHAMLNHAAVSYDSVRGRISAAWRYENGQFILEVEVPANTSAELRLPPSDPVTIRESERHLYEAEGVEPVGLRDGKPTVNLGSGRYRFTHPAKDI